MNKNTELKRCPFCGGEAFPYKHKGFIRIVRCKECGVEVTGYDKEKVMDKWNNRPLEDEAYEAGRLKAMKEICVCDIELYHKTECIGREILYGQGGTDGPKVY